MQNLVAMATWSFRICALLLMIPKEIGDFHGGENQHCDFSWGDMVTVYIRR